MGGYESLGTTVLFGTSYFVILYSTLIAVVAVVMNFAIQIKKTKKQKTNTPGQGIRLGRWNSRTWF